MGPLSLSPRCLHVHAMHVSNVHESDDWGGGVLSLLMLLIRVPCSCLWVMVCLPPVWPTIPSRFGGGRGSLQTGFGCFPGGAVSNECSTAVCVIARATRQSPCRSCGVQPSWMFPYVARSTSPA